MLPRAVAGILFAVCAALAACSLGDFAGYSDGDEITDAASPDAPVVAPDGGGDQDSAPPLPDGAVDASSDAGSKFCETNADAGFFCEDFEGVAPLSHFVDTKTIGGTLIVENGSMIAEIPAGTETASAYGTMSPPNPGSSARVAFRVVPLVVNTTKANACQIAKVYFFGDPGSAAYEVGVGIKGAGSSALYTYEYTENGGGYKEFGDLPSLDPTKPTDLVLEARIDPDSVGGPRVNLYRDGQRVVTDKVLSPPRKSGVIEGFIGLPYVPADHGAWKVRIDDILMSVPP